MSTRCHIQVEGMNHMLYVHCDGYPDYILPRLEKIVADFKKGRGFFDDEYLSAWILFTFMNESVQFPNMYGNSYTGYGISDVEHGDIDFLYIVKGDWSIEYRTV